MGDRIERLLVIPQSKYRVVVRGCVHQYIMRFTIWSLVTFLVGIPPVHLQFLFRSSLGSFLV